MPLPASLARAASAALPLLALALAAPAARAQIVTDQSQTDTSTLIAQFSQTGLAQSFIPSYNNITGAGIFLRPRGNTASTITIALYTALPNAGGQLLATGSTVADDGTYADVSFGATPLNVSSGTTYYLVLTGNSNAGISGATNNPYSRGQVYANGYTAYSGFDYAFRTFSNAGTAAAAPEPGSIALLLVAGVPVVGLVLRRRKARH